MPDESQSSALDQAGCGMLWCLLLLLIGSVSPLAARAQSLSPELATTEVVRESLPLTLTVDGTVEAIRHAMISAQVSDTIRTIKVDIDDFAKQDAILLEFEGVRNRAQLEQARAAIGVAEAQVRDAELEFNRIQRMHREKLVAESQRDKARTGLNTARENLRSARAAAAAVADQVEDVVVRAPFNGYIVKRHVQIGESVGSGQPLFSIVSLDALRVLTRIPQSYLAAVQALWYAHVEVIEPGENRPRRIKVLDMTLFPYADQGTHQVGVRLVLPEQTRDLLPGMMVKAVFAIGEKPRILAPARALFRRSEVSGVYVVKDGRISLRQVRPGLLFDDRIEVLSGLEPGERVALDVVSAGLRLKAQLNAQP